jgi:hypothetical protein
MCYVKVSLLLVIVVSFAAFHFTDFRLVARRQVKGRGRGRAARGGWITVGDD